ncbi:hypothetical protein L6452_13997 [Arctium lappa]|uniref:Uncharacterized protein n=1 Tax=Arctium lappa TaxID=4217 RepID=A0ACB9CJR3_ARCLA|nr:hypothetical protein L6452_13997 [Arctium lappa]
MVKLEVIGEEPFSKWWYSILISLQPALHHHLIAEVIKLGFDSRHDSPKAIHIGLPLQFAKIIYLLDNIAIDIVLVLYVMVEEVKNKNSTLWCSGKSRNPEFLNLLPSVVGLVLSADFYYNPTIVGRTRKPPNLILKMKGGTRFPTLVSQGLLIVWPDENGLERANATMPPIYYVDGGKNMELDRRNGGQLLAFCLKRCAEFLSSTVGSSALAAIDSQNLVVVIANFLSTKGIEYVVLDGF